jgi:hypothetical protein
MNQFSVYKASKSDNPACADLMTRAEQEFAAFFSAVTQLFGPNQASLSAEEWLHELVAMNGLPGSPREWRLITINVSARLASRVNTLDLSRKGPLPVHTLADAQSCCSGARDG